MHNIKFSSQLILFYLTCNQRHVSSSVFLYSSCNPAATFEARIEREKKKTRKTQVHHTPCLREREVCNTIFSSSPLNTHQHDATHTTRAHCDGRSRWASRSVFLRACRRQVNGAGRRTAVGRWGGGRAVFASSSRVSRMLRGARVIAGEDATRVLMSLLRGSFSYSRLGIWWSGCAWDDAAHFLCYSVVLKWGV